MVEIFKTNVRQKQQAKKLIASLTEVFPQVKINFDLDDCDKILRVEGELILINDITEQLILQGIECSLIS